MVLLKQSCRAIIKKPFLTLIFIIQIIVSSNIIYSILNLNNQISEKVDTSIGTFKNKKVYFMQLAGDTGLNIFKGNLSHESINKAYKMFRQGPFYHFYVYTNTKMIKSFPNVEQFIDNPVNDTIDGTKYVTVKTFNMDEYLYTSMNIKLLSGEGFTNSDFNESSDTLSCIVGYNYSSYYNVGDKIEYFTSKNSKPHYLKIVGIMPKNLEILNAFNTDDKTINTDNYIILPTISIEKFNELKLPFTSDFMNSEFYLFNNSYFVFDRSKSDQEINNILDNINSNLESLGIGKQKIRNVNEFLNRDMDFLYSNRDRALSTGLIIILFLALGLITSSIYILNNSKKQYGIYLMSGATLKDISLMILFKNIIIFILGFVISISYLKFIYNQHNGLDLILLFKTFFILILLCLTSLIIPTIKILRLEITALLKEV